MPLFEDLKLKREKEEESKDDESRIYIRGSSRVAFFKSFKRSKSKSSRFN
jgi:hypothetical protein